MLSIEKNMLIETRNMQPPARYIVRTHELRGLQDNRPMATIVHLQDAAVERRKYTSQILATLAVSLGPLTAGLAKGYSSPATYSLSIQRNNSRVSETSPSSLSLTSSSSQLSSVYADRHSSAVLVNDRQISWIASLFSLGALFGALFGGLAMKFGRKNVMLATSVPLFLSWIMICTAASVQQIYAASFIGGFCCAIIQIVSQVYISEISDPSVRGCLSAVLKVLQQTGFLVSYIVGAYMSWDRLALVISVAPILLFFGMLFLPETPSYLVLSDRTDEAVKSLRWLRGGDTYQVQRELQTIRSNVDKSHNRRRSHGEGLGHLVDQLWHPIFITCGLIFFQRFVGVNVFTAFAVAILSRVFHTMDPHAGAIAVGFAQLLASVLSGLLIDTVGRLPLLIVSTAFTSVALAAFGSYAYYADHVSQEACHDWMPLLCVLAFTVAFSLGISPISGLLVGELFPLEYRGLGGALAIAFGHGCSFVSVKMFVDLDSSLRLGPTFWLYSAVGVAGLCFVVCCVPETRGRDLHELQEIERSILRT